MSLRYCKLVVSGIDRNGALSCDVRWVDQNFRRGGIVPSALERAQWIDHTGSGSGELVDLAGNTVRVIFRQFVKLFPSTEHLTCRSISAG